MIGWSVGRWSVVAGRLVDGFKKTHYSKEQPVIVYADDTNILFLLLGHCYNTPSLKDMTRKSDHQQRKCYSVRDFISKLLKRGKTNVAISIVCSCFHWL